MSFLSKNIVCNGPFALEERVEEGPISQNHAKDAVLHKQSLLKEHQKG